MLARSVSIRIITIIIVVCASFIFYSQDARSIEDEALGEEKIASDSLRQIVDGNLIVIAQNEQKGEMSTTKDNMETGVWELKEIKPVPLPAGESNCYPGRSVELGDGSAVFSQGYAPCGGAVERPGKSTSTISWKFPQTLKPGTSLKVTFSIATESDAVPLFGGASVVFYFNSQSAVGVVEHKGRLDDPKLKIPLINKELEVPVVPNGQIGDKITMWVNVSGESGGGDVFYSYEMTTGKQSPSAAVATTSTATTSTPDDPVDSLEPDPDAGKDSGARFSVISGEVEWYPLSDPDDRHFPTGSTILPVDAVVVTGENSIAVISFSDFSTLKVNPESKVVIAAPPNEQPTAIELISGRLWMNVKKIIAGEPIEVNTTLATTSIKGTTFEVLSVPSYDEISVTEGIVTVTHRSTGEKRSVVGGNKLIAVRDGFALPNTDPANGSAGSTMSHDLEKSPPSQGAASQPISPETGVDRRGDGSTQPNKQPIPLGSMENGTNRNGFDYKGFELDKADPKLCQLSCAADTICKAWTYVKPGIQGALARCWLKDRVPPAMADDNCVSGTSF